MAKTTEIKKLVEEFYETRGRVDDNSHRQAKELQSIQSSIRLLATQELTKEEKLQVSDIIGITDEWWCND